MKVIARDYFLRQAEVNPGSMSSDIMKCIAEKISPSVIIERDKGIRILSMVTDLQSEIEQTN